MYNMGLVAIIFYNILYMYIYIVKIDRISSLRVDTFIRRLFARFG